MANCPINPLLFPIIKLNYKKRNIGKGTAVERTDRVIEGLALRNYRRKGLEEMEKKLDYHP